LRGAGVFVKEPKGEAIGDSRVAQTENLGAEEAQIDLGGFGGLK